MKTLLSLCFTAIFFCSFRSSFSQTHENTNLVSVSLDIVAEDKSSKPQNTGTDWKAYYVLITLRNLQDTAVNFTIMSCSWEESFVFDKDSLLLWYPGCDHNVPTELKILPNKAVKFYGKLVCYKKNQDYFNPVSFKIGFAALPSKYFWENHSVKDKLKYKTYWSNTVYLRNNLYEYEEEK